MAKSARKIPRVRAVSRHRADCPNKSSASYVRCGCPKALYWYQGGQNHVETADTCDYQEAEKKAFEKEAGFRVAAAEETEHVTVDAAVSLYLKSKTASGYTHKSIQRLEMLFRERMQTFLAQRGIVFMKDVKRADIEEWRVTWTGAPNTRSKYQGRVIGFFDWAVKSDMIEKNPALGLERIKGGRDVAPTLALNDAQFDAAYSAIGRIKYRAADDVARFRALMLLQRWSGLAIKDAVTVDVTHFKRADDGWYRLFLRRAKTGVDVNVSLAPDVAAIILSAPRLSDRYIFWDGKTPIQQTLTKYGTAYKRVSKLANLKDDDGQPIPVHSHMMRDTFAVWCFTQGMATEDVAALLGHRDIRITQQHYSPWIRLRQERLGAIVKTAFQTWTALAAQSANQGLSEASA